MSVQHRPRLERPQEIAIRLGVNVEYVHKWLEGEWRPASWIARELAEWRARCEQKEGRR